MWPRKALAGGHDREVASPGKEPGAQSLRQIRWHKRLPAKAAHERRAEGAGEGALPRRGRSLGCNLSGRSGGARKGCVHEREGGVAGRGSHLGHDLFGSFFARRQDAGFCSRAGRKRAQNF